MRPVPDFTVSLIDVPPRPKLGVIIAVTRTDATGRFVFVDAPPPVSATSRDAYYICPGESWGRPPDPPWNGFCRSVLAPGPAYSADLYLSRQITNPAPSRVIPTECAAATCTAVGVTSPVTFTWDPIAVDGVYYDVLISAIPTFQQVALVTVRATTLRYSLPPGEYSWQVQARSSLAGAPPAMTFCYAATAGADGCIASSAGAISWNTQIRVQ